MPLPGIASVICLSTRGNSTSCTPSSGPSKTARSGQTKPSNAWSPRSLGGGRRWRPTQGAPCHRWGAADAGHGTRHGASRGAGVGPRLPPAVSDRRFHRVGDGAVKPLWILGAAGAPAGPRSSAEAPGDATAPATLGAGGAVVPAQTPCGSQTPGRLRDDGTGQAGAIGLRGQINTALVERLNLSRRQRVAAIRRRRATSCERAAGWGQPLALVQGYHHFGLPQARLRQALAEPMPTNGRGSAKVGRPCPPAMAAGVTAPVWSRTEGLGYRVPPWPQMQTVSNRILVQDWGIKGGRA